MDLFEIVNVTQVKDKKIILKDINVTIPQKSIFAVFGYSGAGKTTFLRLLNRLDKPYKGEIRFKGKNVNLYSVLDFRKKVGMVFQVPLLFFNTVREDFEFAMKLRGDIREDKMLSVLEKVGLDKKFLDKSSGSLSVGEKQRITIARALLLDPEVLLLDEPTSALDPVSKRNIEHLMKSINKDFGITIVFVSHNLDQIKNIANYGMFLDNGRVLKSGFIEEILSDMSVQNIKAFIAGEGNI